MKAIILAAGRGSRMGDLTADRPKCLVNFRGQALLDWQLSAVRAIAIEDIGIVTGYRREMVAGRGLKEFYNPNWDKTNMVWSLACCGTWLETDACLVSYSDLYYEPSALELLAKAPAPLAITYDPAWLDSWSKRFADPLSDAESFRLWPDGSVREIGRRAERVEDIHGQYMGLLRITPEGWSEMRRHLEGMSTTERQQLHMTDLLHRVASTRVVKVTALAYRGNWAEIDSPSDLAVYDVG